MNRQKLGIALDLKNPRGVEILHKLVGKSDVFVENFRKGVAERLGLGYDDLVKDNPTIVYGSASGYGPEGPDSSKPTFALTGEARSGALWWSGPGDETPYAVGIADQAAGIMLSYGILGAIIARERFGFGQKVDVSHLGSMESIFLTRPRAEWEHAMEAAGDLIYERVQRTLDLVDDPQVVKNSYVVDFDHPVLGNTKWLQTPVTYSKTPLSTRKMAPAHGEDTERLLIELLDYTWDDIASLQEDGVIL